MTGLDCETEDLLRTVAPQVLGALVRRYGHFDAAEDAVQDALLAAARQWRADGRQVVTEAGHHHGGDVLDVDDATAGQWARRGWADPLDTPTPTEREGPSARQGRANVQRRITEELRTDPTRSDRAIAQVVGCDHKTVAKAPPVGTSPTKPTSRPPRAKGQPAAGSTGAQAATGHARGSTGDRPGQWASAQPERADEVSVMANRATSRAHFAQ